MRTLAFICAALAVFSTTAVADEYDLPSMGQPSDTVLPPAEAERIGRRVITQLHAENKILEDPELTDYINRMGTRLARHTDRTPSDFGFYMINDDAVNAFALPGGYIGVNAGLLTKTQTESELAGVLAHEIAHVTQRHIARQIKQTQGMTIATAAAMLLAIVAGGGNPAVVQAAVTMGVANIGQQQINYTRAHELEADRLGIRTLAQANFNPNGMASFFQTMARRSRLYGNRLPEILRTHPISTTRIAEARSRAKDLSAGGINANREYPLMRARARVLASDQPSEVVGHFEDQRGGEQADRSADYGYALALRRVGRSKTALEILQRLNESGPGQPHIALALADALTADGQNEAALALLTELRADNRNDRPLVLAYGRALIADDQAQAARDHLLDQNDLLGRDPVVHEILARASNQLGNKADAYYQQARTRYLRGEYAAAIHRLKTALDLEGLTTSNRSRIESTLARYRDECHQVLSESTCRERVEGIVPS